MSSFTVTTANTTLAGLGISFESTRVTSPFSSGEESFDSLFSDVSLASSRESHPDAGSPPHSPTGQRNHWHVVYASDSDWDESEPDAGFNYFEPYLGVPEVADFAPWPTSPDTATQATETISEPETPSVATTPNDRGYETDTESTRTLQRRSRSRDAHKLARRQRVHYLVQHVQPMIEELPSLEECQRRVAANASPVPVPANEEDIDVALAGEAFVVVEQDITDYGTQAAVLHVAAYDSEDSDVDHYFYDADGNVDLSALLSDSGSRPMHGAVQNFQPLIEDMPSMGRPTTTFASGNPGAPIGLGLVIPTMDDTARITTPVHVGLGFSLDLLPLPLSLSPVHHDDGFETIDLTDDAPASAPNPCAPAAPALRPYLADESPSPIVLASPMPAFRRFDDVLGFAADAEPEYAVRQRLF